MSAVSAKALLAVVTSTALLFAATTATADNVAVTHDFNGTGLSVAFDADHTEGSPFKGSLTLSTTNTGAEAWGGFRFEVLAQQVYFVDGTINGENWDPTSTQSPLSWLIDPVDQSWIELSFLTDPVNPGQSATFTVYTDNTALQHSFFAVTMYPLPVPEPATLSLLLVGSLFTLRRR